MASTEFQGIPSNPTAFAEFRGNLSDSTVQLGFVEFHGTRQNSWNSVGVPRNFKTLRNSTGLQCNSAGYVGGRENGRERGSGSGALGRGNYCLSIVCFKVFLPFRGVRGNGRRHGSSNDAFLFRGVRGRARERARTRSHSTGIFRTNYFSDYLRTPWESVPRVFKNNPANDSWQFLCTRHPRRFEAQKLECSEKHPWDHLRNPWESIPRDCTSDPGTIVG